MILTLTLNVVCRHGNFEHGPLDRWGPKVPTNAPTWVEYGITIGLTALGATLITMGVRLWVLPRVGTDGRAPG